MQKVLKLQIHNSINILTLNPFDQKTKDSTRKHFKTSMHTLSAMITTIMNHDECFLNIQKTLLNRNILGLSGRVRETPQHFIQKGESFHQIKNRLGSLLCLFCGIYFGQIIEFNEVWLLSQQIVKNVFLSSFIQGEVFLTCCRKGPRSCDRTLLIRQVHIPGSQVYTNKN